MKSLIVPIVAAAVASAAPAVALAQAAFPSKTITIVVPTAAGGGNDAMARTIGQKLARLLGQTLIIDNRAGANGSIASEFVARAVPDGHTLMLGYIATHSMNPALQKLKYDPVADFEPVGLVGYSPTLMVANAAVAVKDVKDLVAQLKAKPDKYTYASAGNGTAPHFAAELFKLNAGVVMLGVPYKGSAPAVSDTIGGQTQFMFPSLFTALPHVKSGKLKALAVTTEQRSQALPDVPAVSETLKGFAVDTWWGLVAPAGTPRDVVSKLHLAFVAALNSAEAKTRFATLMAEPVASTPEQFAAFMKNELAKYEKVVKASGAKVD